MLSERWLASVRIVGSTIFGSTRSTASRTDRARPAGSPAWAPTPSASVPVATKAKTRYAQVVPDRPHDVSFLFGFAVAW